jgi:hypothetical protein
MALRVPSRVLSCQLADEGYLLLLEPKVFLGDLCLFHNVFALFVLLRIFKGVNLLSKSRSKGQQAGPVSRSCVSPEYKEKSKGILT